MSNIYIHKPEKWSTQKCERIAKRWTKDAYGTMHPFPGYLGGSRFAGEITYNGGIVINDQWYRGEFFSLPNVPKEFNIIYVNTWGWRLIKQD